MLRNMKRIFVVLACLLCLNFVVGCEEQGTMEKAGEQVDESMQTMEENVEQAGEEAGQMMEEAGEETGQMMEEAGEKMQE